MKCTVKDCNEEAAVVPIITVPCNHDPITAEAIEEGDCQYEHELLVAQEMCRVCQAKAGSRFNWNFPEFVTLVTNSMREVGHEPNFGKTYINWVSISSEQYQMYMKLKEAHVSKSLFEAGKQLLH